MIDFRYHLVSIIAVFFALAVGIVLGAGPLGERVEEDLPAQLNSMREQNSDLQSQLLAFETSQQYQQDFVDLVADELVSERLSGESVLVIGLPGVGGDRLGSVGGMLERAGATVTGTMEVDGSWTAPESEAALDALAVDLTTRPLATDGDGYARGAEVLANAVLTAVQPEDVPVDPPSGLDGSPGDPSELMIEESVVTAFSEAGFVDVEGELTAKANIAVVVADPTELAEPPAEGVGEEDGEDIESGSESDGQSEEWFDRMIDLIGMLDQAARGVVVAGERDTAAGHDVIGIIRSGEDVEGEISTVDSVELATGQVAVVYAVAEQSEGGSGHYGLTESAGALSPPIPALPEPAAPTEGEENPEGDDAGSGDDEAEEGTDGESTDGDGEGDTEGDEGAESQDGGPDEDDAVGAGIATKEGEAL